MESEDSGIKTLVKCFIHGIMFSLLFSMLAFAWFLGLIFLMVGMAFFGLLIGVAVLLPLIGLINRFITVVIWEIETSSALKSLFLHGLALIVLVFAANIGVASLVGLVFPGIYSTIIGFFFLFAIIDGYIAKSVATYFPREIDNEAAPSYESRRQYLENRYQEDFKCGNCFWFGKEGCERKEEYINSSPCTNFMAKYAD